MPEYKKYIIVRAPFPKKYILMSKIPYRKSGGATNLGLVSAALNFDPSPRCTYLNLPIFLRCENISPPGTYSRTMYKLELS